MSPLVTRPSLPVPGTAAGSTPVSPAMRRTDGASGASAAATLGGGWGGAAPERPAAAPSAGSAGGAAAAGLAAPAPAIDRAQQRADRDRGAVLGGDLGQHAGGGRGHFDRHLVGLQFDQRLVDARPLALLLEPLADGRFGHGFAQRGYSDFGHGVWS